MIGDLQGCLEPLKRLLDKLKYQPENDQLWFTGDIVNRGPQSLETLRFVTKLPTSTITVLGNHDLTLLAAYYGYIKPLSKDTYQEILSAQDAPDLIAWLQHQPIMYEKNSVVLCHAGIYPLWDIETARACAHEIEALLKEDHHSLLKQMYGNEPATWDPASPAPQRWRFIVNAFTRMRLCYPDGRLELKTKGEVEKAPSSTIPWYQFPHRKAINERIIFGHWAALNGKCPVANISVVDTGCVWGNSLTALCLETDKCISVSCK